MPKDYWFRCSPAVIIDRYFMEERNSYTGRRAIKMKNLIWTLCGLGALLIAAIFYFGGKPEESNSGVQPDFHPDQHISASSNQGLSIGQTPEPPSKPGFFNFSGISLGGGASGSPSSRTHAANQVIHRGSGGNDPGSTLPMGHAIPVKLLNAILSTNSVSPVIAEVIQDVFTPQRTLSVPQGARAIGTAQYDEPSRRIQLRFQNFVYPDGSQHSLAASGLMGDGSAGLEGDYHSGESQRQLGRFLGHFVSGMADGMKSRQAGGPFGMSVEQGSIKNGILGGVALSAEDQAKSVTEDLSNAKPYMTLPAGQTFILFLEHEYVP